MMLNKTYNKKLKNEIVKQALAAIKASKLFKNWLFELVFIQIF